MRKITIYIFGCLCLLTACVKPDEKAATSLEEPWIDSTLTEDLVRDKVLGYLVGSAIGDAHGAPTEMWYRGDILSRFGYVDSLDAVIREASAEGPWKTNLPAGGTTDDTRWKLLLNRFLLAQATTLKDLSAQAFARHILNEYEMQAAALAQLDTLPADHYLTQEMKVHWLQEWAAVSKGYLSQQVDQYRLAVNKFYGGDLACGGLLYAPGLGVFYAGRPELAYRNAFDLGLYDLGYARDITAISAAVAAAMCRPGVNPDSAVAEAYTIDPHHYGSARLLGRMSRGIYEDALYITKQARTYQPATTELKDLKIPSGWAGTSEDYLRQEKVYNFMDERLQRIPFHAGEIWMIALTAMMYTNYDFLETLQFITNYGRDNDTAGAVAGAILGAYHGYNQLPEPLCSKVERTNADELNQDLGEQGRLLAQKIWARKGQR